jgi:hypothetical protein
MTCPKCSQEHDDNQPCPNCTQEQGVGQDEDKQPNDNLAATSAPPNDDQEGKKANLGNNEEINVRNSRFRAGRDIKIYLKAIDDADESHKGEEEKSLWDFVKPLTPRAERHYRPSQADLQNMVASLVEDQVILISSSYDEYALDVAWEVIEAMPESRDRFSGRLAFEGTVGKGVEFSPQKLCEQRPEAEPAIVLLVEAFDNQANTFPTSMLGHSARVEAAKHDLKNRKLFLVVVVNHEYATETKLSQPNRSYKSLSYWNIPFLEPFFKTCFADYEQLLAELAQQRAKWDKDESIFTQQVVNYQANDILRDVINNGGPKDPDSSAESLLKTAGPVEKTVLYTATFFNEITSPEFCRVVESLLGTRTMLKDAHATTTNEATPATGKIEVPLRRIWDDEKDEIFTELLVETSTATDSPLTVSLSEFNLAKPLRKQFEKRYRFYLIDQFKALQQTGIFFYPSLRLAKNTTELAIDLAQLYPDEFNEGWIVTMVMRIREHFATRASDEDLAEDSMFHFLSNTQPGASNVAFARVSEICKRFLDSPQKSVVPNSLEYLMQNDYQKEVLWLIKQLKFNLEFDDWHWLKQLLNRGDLKTKYLTYYYILSYLKQLGTRIYEGLEKIESWLPPTDRSNFTDFHTFISRILTKYCLDTINGFNDKHYGKWPSRYALFTLTDVETANSRFDLLTNCLLHPGIDRTLVGLNIDGTRIDLIGILLAEWSFILLGTPSTPQTPARNGKEDLRQSEVENCTASQMLDLLLKQFLGRLDSPQRLELLKYWTQLDSALFHFGHSHSIADEQRNEMKWKRVLVQQLIRELKLASSARPMAKKSPGPILTNSHA